MQILVMIYGIPQPEILKSPPPSTSYTSFAAAAESSGQAGPRTSELAHASTESLSEDQHDPYASEDQHTDDYYDDGGALDPYGTTAAGGHHYQSNDAATNEQYLPDVTPRAPPTSQLPPTRSTNQIPPMRQPPAGPPPVRPRVDSLPRRTSRPGPPGQPPSMAPPPLPTAPLPPLPQQSGQYDLASPPIDDRQRYGFPRDARPSGSVEHHVSVPEDGGEILDDWDDDSEDPAEVEEIRRSYVPPSQTQRPRTKRQGTSDSEGSMLTGARRHDLHYSQQQQPPIGIAQNDPGYADHQHYPSSQFHPFAQPDIPTHVDEDRPHPFSSSRPPTPGNRPRGNTQSSATSSRSGESSAFSDRPRTPPPMPQLVSNTTAQGTISQRRKVNGPVTAGGSSASLDVYEPHHPPASRSHSPAAMEASSSTSAPQSRLTSLQPSGGSAVSLSATSSANTTVGRHRAASQPGRRPSLVGMHAPPSSFPGADVEPVPPLPQTALPRKTSFTNSSQSIRTASSATAFSGHPSLPPLSIAAAQAPSTPSGFYASAAGANLAPSSSTQPGVPKSPLPPPPPAEILRRPYHLMYLLYISITAGGYISRKLHVPRDVWTQGGAKLTSLPEKGKCVAIIDQGLDELSKASKEFLRAAQVNAAGLSGTGISRAVGERWLRALDEWVQVCDGVVGNLGKKLGVGDGGASKKAAGWGNKVSRTFDRMTNGKRCVCLLKLDKLDQSNSRRFQPRLTDFLRARPCWPFPGRSVPW